MILTCEDVKTMKYLLDTGWTRISLSEDGNIAGQFDIVASAGVFVVSYRPDDSSVLVWNKNTDENMVTFAFCGDCSDVVKQAKCVLRAELQRQIDELV